MYIHYVDCTYVRFIRLLYTILYIHLLPNFPLIICYSYTRLELLSAKYHLYILLNAERLVS